MAEVCAYVLIEVETGYVKDVVRELKKIKDIEAVCVVTGPFDIIVHLSGESVKEIGDLVISKIQPIEGILNTTTCICTDCICECTCKEK